ncbi:hypothetical protein EOI86_17460 [Hwanghaeella grinnelliae]|uniref:Uncharacterized protein n=1 Tax=Hwanghaeella grinnelliae TaxID=2500179 RepID=A0A437QJG5_9PROT|nr:hypothetical protein [Hwanghaeella grinnelliae]RVU34645.1 hypothetical protein EOI86_17460 [Hwanghaeella grinnelliae]
MAPRINPLKLNKLQLRTLALVQVLINEAGQGMRDPETGDVILPSLPAPHGDHVHIGPYVVSAREISGFSNKGVWAALARKGLARGGPPVTITAEGLAYDTGLSEQFVAPSDH